MVQEHRHAAYYVSRAIAVEQPSSTLNKLNEVKCRLPGLQELKLNMQRARLTVTYDSAVVSFSTILMQLANAGILPIDSRWSRLRAAWYSYTDRNAAEQAHTRPKGCCNRVPKA